MDLSIIQDRGFANERAGGDAAKILRHPVGRLLKPPGNSPPNSVKFFAALEVLEQAKDRTWLARVTNAVNLHWQKKNAAKKESLPRLLQPLP